MVIILIIQLWIGEIRICVESVDCFLAHFIQPSNATRFKFFDFIDDLMK